MCVINYRETEEKIRNFTNMSYFWLILNMKILVQKVRFLSVVLYGIYYIIYMQFGEMS